MPNALPVAQPTHSIEALSVVPNTSHQKKIRQGHSHSGCTLKCISSNKQQLTTATVKTHNNT